MKEYKNFVWVQIPGTSKGKIYNYTDIDPIAVWLGRFINHGVEDEDYVRYYRREACEVYELAHLEPEWLKRAEESPWNCVLDLSDYREYTLREDDNEETD